MWCGPFHTFFEYFTKFACHSFHSISFHLLMSFFLFLYICIFEFIAGDCWFCSIFISFLHLNRKILDVLFDSVTYTKLKYILCTLKMRYLCVIYMICGLVDGHHFNLLALNYGQRSTNHFARCHNQLTVRNRMWRPRNSEWYKCEGSNRNFSVRQKFWALSDKLKIETRDRKGEREREEERGERDVEKKMVLSSV